MWESGAGGCCGAVVGRRVECRSVATAQGVGVTLSGPFIKKELCHALCALDAERTQCTVLSNLGMFNNHSIRLAVCQG